MSEGNSSLVPESDHPVVQQFLELYNGIDKENPDPRKYARTTPALQVNIATDGGQQVNLLGDAPTAIDEDQG